MKKGKVHFYKNEMLLCGGKIKSHTISVFDLNGWFTNKIEHRCLNCDKKLKEK